MPQNGIELKLNGGLRAIVDAEDVERVTRYNWNAIQSRNTWYAHTVTDYRKIVLMHRFIVQPPYGYLVDHVNGNGLDNRRCNLRISTHSQNAANRGKPRLPNATSRYKGVYWDKHGLRKKRWRAAIKVNGMRIRLGLFSSESEAAIAYDKAAVKHFGEFATLNFG